MASSPPLAATLSAPSGSTTEPFRPHVTLARARGRSVDLRAWLEGESAPAPEGRSTVDELAMRSHLGRGPARYERCIVSAARSTSPCLTAAVAQRPRIVAVIGDGDPRGPDAHRILELAEEVGQTLARGGATVVTGGLGGVMRAASRGARGVDGETIGILPGDRSGRGQRVRPRRRLPPGLGVVRNLVVVTSADAVVAIGGRHGTLSEIGLALRMGRHVVTLSSWRVESDQRLGGPQVHRAKDPRDAAALALRLAKEGPAAPT